MEVKDCKTRTSTASAELRTKRASSYANGAWAPGARRPTLLASNNVELPPRPRPVENAMQPIARTDEPPLTSDEIRVYRRLLLEDFSARRREVRELESRAFAPAGLAGQREVDESLGQAELAADIAVIDAEDRLEHDIDEALERIATGTFGRCEDCGRTIGRLRLELVPYARCCTACAQTREAVGYPT